jgi:hypothetical protein
MVHRSRRKQSRSIQGLEADGPDPDFEKKLMLFGQFVGDWEIHEARYKQPDGSWAKMKGEVHFGWILGGTAVQDVWIGRPEGSDTLTVYGTTIRFYDPKIDAWQSTWLSPIKGLVRVFIGRQVGKEIVLETKTAEGQPEKWIFSEITSQSFRWRSEESHDNGKTWTLTEEMRIRRIDTVH